jgi:hypothetical protein
MKNNIGDIKFKPIVVPTGEPSTTAIASGIATAIATIAASWDSWRLFQGHSEWYLWDQDLRIKHYDDLIAITAKWYKDGGVNNHNLLEKASDQANQYNGTVRYELLPIIYKETNNKFIGYLIAEYASAGALPKSLIPKDIYNEIYKSDNKTNISSSNLLLYALIGLGIIFLIKRK